MTKKGVLPGASTVLIIGGLPQSRCRMEASSQHTLIHLIPCPFQKFSALRMERSVVYGDLEAQCPMVLGMAGSVPCINEQSLSKAERY